MVVSLLLQEYGDPRRVRFDFHNKKLWKPLFGIKAFPVPQPPLKTVQV